MHQLYFVKTFETCVKRYGNILSFTDCNSLLLKCPNVFAVVSERYGLSLLGCILIIGGTYLFVAFGPNVHEKLKAENVVKHIVGWPVLLYLVRYFNFLEKCRRLSLNRSQAFKKHSALTKQVLNNSSEISTKFGIAKFRSGK